MHKAFFLPHLRYDKDMRKVEYIYEDKEIIVCHKPQGMATEGARAGQMDLVSQVRNYLARKGDGKAKKAKPPYVATVYRLDQPVEGVVVLAKTKAAASSLTKQIKDHTTDKYYYARCYGNVPENNGHLENMVYRREDNGFADVAKDGEDIRAISGEVKKAELFFEVLSREENTTLLKIKLITGRFHQIRIQLKEMGYPILGDSRYGTDESNKYSKENEIKGVCLACCKFSFDHPSTGKRCSFEITPWFADEDI